MKCDVQNLADRIGSRMERIVSGYICLSCRNQLNDVFRLERIFENTQQHNIINLIEEDDIELSFYSGVGVYHGGGGCGIRKNFSPKHIIQNLIKSKELWNGPIVVTISMSLLERLLND